MFDRVLNTPLKSEVFPLCLSGNFLKKALSIFLETFSCTYVKVYLNIMQSHIKVTIYSLNPFPAGNFKKFRYSKKTNIEITKSKIFTRFSFITKLCSQEWTWLCNKVETRKDFRFCYFWLYFVYQNFQNGYFRIILLTIYSLINIFL